MSQHKKACSTCPFSKLSKPGELGGSPVEMYVGQAYGPFFLPCHEATDYSDPNWKSDYNKPQCAGAAIYRSNCHPAHRPPMILNLPAGSDDNVFKTPEQFVAHHMCIDEDLAQMLTRIVSPKALYEKELNNPDNKFVPAT